MENFSNVNLTNATGHQSFAKFTEVEHALIFIFLAVLGILIVLTNAFVIYLVQTTSYLQTSTNYSLASLACADFLAGFLAIPLIIISSITGKRGLFLAMDLCSRFICLTTILHLSSIALERYILIVHKMNSELMSKKSTLIILPGLWIFALTLTLIQLSWIDFNTEKLDAKKGMEKVEVIYDLCCIFILVFLPLIIIIYAYVRIYIIVRRQHNSVSRQTAHIDEALTKRKKRLKKEIRAVIIYAGMVLTFMLGWFYYFLVGLMVDLELPDRWLGDIPPWVHIVLLFMRFATSLVNPILYTFFKMDFHKAVKSFKRRIGCVSRNEDSAASLGMRIMKGRKHVEPNENPLVSRMETSYSMVCQPKTSIKSMDVFENHEDKPLSL